MNSTTPNSGFRNTKPESMTSGNSYNGNRKSSIEPPEMKMIEDSNSKQVEKDPLMLKFRKITNLKIMEEHSKSDDDEDHSEDRPSKPQVCFNCILVNFIFIRLTILFRNQR